jgi:hypothetical protein
MVKNVKSALKKCLGNNLLTKEELMTLLTEIEYAVNSRPLTQVTDNIDSFQAITPNDFLISNIVGYNLVNSLQQGHDLLHKFWKVWSNNYLCNLPKCVPQFYQRGSLDIGKMVLIQEDNVTRMQWPLGRVTEVFPGKDGKIRTAAIKTKNGIVIRPIQRLCILESGKCVGEDQTLALKDISNEVCKPENPKGTVVVKYISDEDIV